jgi:DNA-directed RNA polymerase
MGDLQNDLLENLHSCKNTLAGVNPSSNETLFTKRDLVDNFQKQIDHEKAYVINVPSIIQKQQNNDNVRNCMSLLKTVRTDIREQVTKAFYKRVALLGQSKTPKDLFLHPFLTCMPSNLYIEVIMQDVEQLCFMSPFFSESKKSLEILTGQVCELKFNQNLLTKNDTLSKKLENAYAKYTDYIVKNDFSTLNHRQIWMDIVEKENLKIENFQYWSSNVKMLIGEFIYEIIINDIMIDLDRIKNILSLDTSNNIVLDNDFFITKTRDQNGKLKNAFYTIYRIHGHKRHLEMKTHPVLTQLFITYSPELTFRTVEMPMVVPPLPWCDSTYGGYYLTKSNLLRLYRNEQYESIEKKPKSQLYPIYDSLNALANCPWKLNTRILDLLISVFNQNGNKKLNIPSLVKDDTFIPQLPENRIEKSEYFKILQEREEKIKTKADMYGLWCTELYRLSIANMVCGFVFLHFSERNERPM